jgi:hypothetical protein
VSTVTGILAGASGVGIGDGGSVRGGDIGGVGWGCKRPD